MDFLRLPYTVLWWAVLPSNRLTVALLLLGFDFSIFSYTPKNTPIWSSLGFSPLVGTHLIQLRT